MLGRQLPGIACLVVLLLLVCFLSLFPASFSGFLVSWPLFLVPLCFSAFVAFPPPPALFHPSPCGVLIQCHVVERHPFGVCCPPTVQCFICRIGPVGVAPSSSVPLK